MELTDYKLWLSKRQMEQPLVYKRASSIILAFYRYKVSLEKNPDGRKIDLISLEPLDDKDILWVPLEKHPKYIGLWRDQAFHFDYFHIWICTRKAPIHPVLNQPFTPYQIQAICKQYDKRRIHPPYCIRMYNR